METFYSIFPLAIIGAGILVSIIIEMYLKKSEVVLPWISILIFLVSGFYSLTTVNSVSVSFSGMFATGGNVNIFFFIFTFGAALVSLLSVDYLRKYDSYFGEFYILLQSSVLGMMLMAGAKDLFVIFLGLELMSICFYVLSGINRKRLAANEVFLICLLFNFSAFPFHMWVPDFSQGSGTTVAELFSTGGKAAAFSAIIVTFFAVFSGAVQNIFEPYLSVIAVLS